MADPPPPQQQQQQQQQHAVKEQELKINNSLRNRAFESWKLGATAPPARAAAPLPSRVRQAASADAVDYLHTRAAALRNHLACDGRGVLYVLTGAPGAPLVVCEVAASGGGSGGEHHGPPAVSPIAELPPLAACGDAPRPAEAPLDASIAVAYGGGAGGSVGDGSGSSGAPAAARWLLVSEGRGDLRLVAAPPPGAGAPAPAAASAPLYPLRPPAPLAGARPFVLLDALLAAGSSSGGDGSFLLHAFAWAVKEAPGGGPKGRHCEVWALLLRAETDGSGSSGGSSTSAPPPPRLSLVAAELLTASADVPHAAAASARADGGGAALVLAAAPAPDDDDDGVEVVYGHGARPPPTVTTASGLGATGGGGDGGNGGDDEDDDGDDIDPRTLAQAAARLAHLTSDARAGALPRQQWTDVYKESEPDGGGGGDGEQGCEVSLFTAAAGAAEAAAAAAAAAAAGGPAVWRRAATVHGGAHKLLSAQRTCSGGGGLLLGVSDDVDCAVFHVRAVTEGGATGAVAAAAAAGPSLAADHAGLVPALAYVAASKTQRRHTLVAAPGGPVAAAIVEGQRYCYAYGAVARGQAHGLQRVLDMELPGGGRVLGAALVQQPCAPAAAAAADGAAGGASSAAAGRGAVQLLLLTESDVIALRLA